MAANPLATPWPLTLDFRIPADGTPTLLCRGRLTGETSELFRSEVKKLIGRNHLLVVDLNQVTFVDSSGLGAIVAAFVSAKRAGDELRFIHLSERVKDLLRITRLTAFFDGSRND